MKDLEAKILTPEARLFLDELHRKFNPERLRLLGERNRIQAEINAGAQPHFLDATRKIRDDSSWSVAKIPADLAKRQVEITGPVDAKMMINALNSGADVFMADFEDSLSPTWPNILNGQSNLIDAVARTLRYVSPEGKEYQLKPETATLMVRPRGWHLEEKHYLVDGEPISASLFDFGLTLFHTGRALLDNGSGPYFYLPKLENHQEARLWAKVIGFAEKKLELPSESVKVTVLIETILAAFEMDEILYELKDYIVALNAGRWDYLFSIIKKFSQKKDFIFPDRSALLMTVPFMRAYTALLVQTCHKRKAHAIGGMAAFIPNRKDPELNARAIEKVKNDKLREVAEGFDGTWVAHPDLVPVAAEIFYTGLQGHPDQKSILRDKEIITDKQLLNFAVPGANVTLQGVTDNIAVALMYLASWLKGIGAAQIHNLMEDAATCEISRSQLWQCAHHNSPFSLVLLKEMIAQEKDGLQKKDPRQPWKQAETLLKKLVENKQFADFLTTEAYKILPDENKS